MPVTSVTAPDAPARMGEPVEPTAMLRYLEALGAWRDARRQELDELDRLALASPDSAALAPDVTLAMALWQAVAVRYGELEKVWDSGRVGIVERQRLSALVWGRLDAAGTGASLAVSLPEACRLSDALAAQLRLRLSLDPVGLDLAAHLRAMRAALERLRDLVSAEPAGPVRDGGAARLGRLERRLTELTGKAQRGADVGGLVGPWETDAAVAERDLIVAAATRRDAERNRARAEARRADLIAQAEAVARTADICVGRVRPAPTLGIPRVEALGPVPSDPAAVDAYLTRLDAVGRALAHAEEAYSAPLAEVDRLRALLDLYRAKAEGTGLTARLEVREMYRLAGAVVHDTPTDLPRARTVLAAYQTLLGDAPIGGTR
jgi:hypothetical protein